MIDCIFTIDYEIYGNGEGSLSDLVCDPAQKLISIFDNLGVRFVPFIEVAEFEMIESAGSDPDIDLVKQQIRYFNEKGFEIGLHLHPQWYNAEFSDGRWDLDYSEYNLCALSEKRISEIVNRGLGYLQNILGIPGFVPISFRAGNWLLQPTSVVASILAEQGIKIDSSVFKGGMQYKYGLDYRQSLKNGYYWKFDDDVNVYSEKGVLIEVPIYTQIVPFWKMLTGKRLTMQKKSKSSSGLHVGRLERIRDYLRLGYPLKFDFCRMTLRELVTMMEVVIREDRCDSTIYRPLVAIGHTKDLVDPDTVEAFLGYLQEENIRISTFAESLDKCTSEMNKKLMS